MHSLFLYVPGTGNNFAVKVFIRGWRSYYYVTDMKHILQGWKECLRRRLRLLHLETVEEAGIKEGDEIEVKLIDIDPKTGKFKLSRKVLMPRPEKK